MTTAKPAATTRATTKVPADIVAAAQRSHRKWGIPASISIAQWAVESGWGKHAPGNNPFGMKPRKGKNDPQQMLMTREWSKARGNYYLPQPFRVFASIADAFEAHAELLATAPVYAKARAKLPDPRAFADALTGVYATDPKYGTTLKSVMGGSANLYAFNDLGDTRQA
jgi:flagellum-specific peptidoglycan hydrolase FlgJ